MNLKNNIKLGGWLISYFGLKGIECFIVLIISFWWCKRDIFLMLSCTMVINLIEDLVSERTSQKSLDELTLCILCAFRVEYLSSTQIHLECHFLSKHLKEQWTGEGVSYNSHGLHHSSMFPRTFLLNRQHLLRSQNRMDHHFHLVLLSSWTFEAK